MAYGQTLVSILLDHPAGPAAPIRFSRTAHKDAKEPSQLLSTLQCTGQRHLINKLQMPANRNTIRQPRNLDAERLQQPRNVHRRGFALGVRIGGEDNLLGLLLRAVLGDLAQAVKALKLRYAVITSPDRDDLKDGGAKHFAAVISELRKAVEGIKVEILVPDFKKKEAIALQILSETPPDVFNHNIETVPRLYRVARPGASYEGSLSLLRSFAEQNPHIPTKSGLMLGLGETDEEVMEVLGDLRCHKVDRVTIGQYLAPSKAHLPVRRYVSPQDFELWHHRALEMGFKSVHAGVFVRSSYHASDDSLKTR